MEIIAIESKNKGLFDKLRAAQAEIKAPKENKGARYSYRTVDEICESAKPACNKAGLVFWLDVDFEYIEGRRYCKATCYITDGETILRVEAKILDPEARQGMDPSQSSAATATYAKKQALANAFALDDSKEEDLELKNANGNTTGGGYITPEQVARIKALCEPNVEANLPRVCALYKVDDITKLTFDQAEDAIAKRTTAIERKKRAAAAMAAPAPAAPQEGGAV